MDILTIIGATLFASASTYYLASRKKKDADVFTIKSDGVKIEDDTYGGYQPKAGPPKERPDAPPPPQSQPISPAPEMILDMRNVTGIIVEGSPTFELSDGHISVSEDASIKVKKHTLWISLNKNDNLKVGMFTSNFNYVENKILKTIPTINFVTTNLTRCSVHGSGDISLLNSKLANEFDAIVQGSGDIELRGISTGRLSLSVKGSGDILIDKHCRASSTLAKIKGSGDITIKSDKIGAISRQINGSGDINEFKGYGKFFHEVRSDMKVSKEVYNSNWNNRTNYKVVSHKPTESFFQGVTGILKE